MTREITIRYDEAQEAVLAAALHAVIDIEGIELVYDIPPQEIEVKQGARITTYERK